MDENVTTLDSTRVATLIFSFIKIHPYKFFYSIAYRQKEIVFPQKNSFRKFI